MIKLLIPENINQLQSLCIRTYRDHYTQIWSEEGIERYIESQFNIQRLIEETASSDIEYYILQLGKDAVGILKLKYKRPFPLEQNLRGLEIEKIYFSKDVAGHGYGSEVIQQVTKIAKQKKENFIWLNVLKSNERAIRFYERNGFSIVGELPFKSDILDIGMNVMKKNIS